MFWHGAGFREVEMIFRKTRQHCKRFFTENLRYYEKYLDSTYWFRLYAVVLLYGNSMRAWFSWLLKPVNMHDFSRKKSVHVMVRVISFLRGAPVFTHNVSHALERKCKFNREFSRSLVFFSLWLQFLVDLYFVISPLKITTSNLGLLRVCLVYERYISRTSQENPNPQQT